MKRKKLKAMTLIEVSIYLVLFIVISSLIYQFFTYLIHSRSILEKTTSNYSEETFKDTVEEALKQADFIDHVLARQATGCWREQCPRYDQLICVGYWHAEPNDISFGCGDGDCALNLPTNCYLSAWYNKQDGCACVGNPQNEDNKCFCNIKSYDVGLNGCWWTNVGSSLEPSYEWNCKKDESINLSEMHPYNHWAWNDQNGWLDLKDIKLDHNSLQLIGTAKFINESDIISFNCQTTNTCSSNPYYVYMDPKGDLHGYAWGERIGWISFNCQEGGTSQNDICDTLSNYKVSIDPGTGEWNGYAWSENIGWISFNCKTGGNNQSDICATSNYKTAFSTNRKGVLQYNFSYLNNDQMVNRNLNFDFNLFKNFTVSSITPDTGANNNLIVISNIAGNGFENGATVVLRKAGENDIYPNTHFQYVSGSSLTNGVFDLQNKKAGVYDVIVINPNGNSGILKNGFTITSGS